MKLWSDFDEDAFAVEEPVGDEADGYESYGEGQRRDVVAAVEGEEIVVAPEPCGDGLAVRADGVGDFDPDQIDDEKVGDAVGDDGVGAEDEPGED